MKTHVETVTTKPDRVINFAYGVASQESAQKWGEKNGYTTVYWLKSKQKVYAVEGEEK